MTTTGPIVFGVAFGVVDFAFSTIVARVPCTSASLRSRTPAARWIVVDPPE